jgi:hypothetical protein
MGKPGNLQDLVLDGWVPSAGTVNAFKGDEDAVKESDPLHAAHAIWNCAALGEQYFTSPERVDRFRPGTL